MGQKTFWNCRIFHGTKSQPDPNFPNYLLTVDKTQVLQGAARFTANHPVIGKTINELTQKMWLKSFSTPPHISGGHKTHYERMKPAACWSLGHAGHGTQPSGREDVCSAPHHCPGCNSHLFCSSQWARLSAGRPVPEGSRAEENHLRWIKAEEMWENYSLCTAASAGSTGQTFLRLIFSFIMIPMINQLKRCCQKTAQKGSTQSIHLWKWSAANNYQPGAVRPRASRSCGSWDVKLLVTAVSQPCTEPADWQFSAGMGSTGGLTPERCCTPVSPQQHRLSSTEWAPQAAKATDDVAPGACSKCKARLDLCGPVRVMWLHTFLKSCCKMQRAHKLWGGIYSRTNRSYIEYINCSHSKGGHDVFKCLSRSTFFLCSGTT